MEELHVLRLAFALIEQRFQLVRFLARILHRGHEEQTREGCFPENEPYGQYSN
jgi:hypothetical protein